MNERPTSPQPSALPAVRPPVPVPAVFEPQTVSESAESGAGDGTFDGSSPSQPARWRRVCRTRRGAAGLGIAAAALLLWPFAGWSPLPWLAGLGALVLLHLLRLDRLLRGWVWHFGGLVVVAGLMLSTGPWDWALAASIGVLLAGLVQLPRWRLVAVGALLCVLAGVGFGITHHQDAEQVAAEQVRTQLQNRGQLGAARPQGVLPVLLSSIARGDAGAVCDNLLTESARASFTAAVGRPDCPAAVRALAARVVDPIEYAEAKAPSERRDEEMTVDACQLSWRRATPPGPQLAQLMVGRTTGPTYVVTALHPC